MKLFCTFIGHRVNRRRAWHDGLNFRTDCERCGTPLLRDRDQWRPFDIEHDTAVERATHPHNARAIGS